MVLNMFYLKAAEELSPHAWTCVLDKDFTCISPITPFRSFMPSEVGYTLLGTCVGVVFEKNRNMCRIVFGDQVLGICRDRFRGQTRN